MISCAAPQSQASAVLPQLAAGDPVGLARSMRIGSAAGWTTHSCDEENVGGAHPPPGLRGSKAGGDDTGKLGSTA